MNYVFERFKTFIVANVHSPTNDEDCDINVIMSCLQKIALRGKTKMCEYCNNVYYKDRIQETIVSICQKYP